MAIQGKWRYSRHGSEIVTHGIDFDGKITVWFACGHSVEIWHLPGRTTWGGNGGCARIYLPAELMFVRTIEGDESWPSRFGILVDGIKSPRKESDKQSLVAWADRLNDDPEALPELNAWLNDRGWMIGAG